MENSYLEYAAAHPKEAPAPVEIPVKDAQARRDDMEAAAEMMGLILDYLEQGRPPELILYKAIDCIERLTNDDQWASEAKAQLDNTYEKIAQQSIDVDAAEAARAAALDRLEKFEARALRQLQAIEAEAEAVSRATKQARAAIQTRQMMEGQS